MTTATLLRPTAATITPTTAHQEINFKMSLAVMKNSVRLALSTVAFCRGMFPNDAFAYRQYAGVNLVVLRPLNDEGKIHHQGALSFHQWVEKGAFHALDHGYLERLVLMVLDRNPAISGASVIETYSFSITKESEHVMVEAMDASGRRAQTSTTMTAPTREDVHVAVQSLIKELVVLMSSLDPLPANRWITMYMVYNEKTPPSYQSPYFCVAEKEALPKFGGHEPSSHPIGKVYTGLHSIRLSFKQVQARALSDSSSSRDALVPAVSRSTSTLNTQLDATPLTLLVDPEGDDFSNPNPALQPRQTPTQNKKAKISKFGKKFNHQASIASIDASTIDGYVPMRSLQSKTKQQRSVLGVATSNWLQPPHKLNKGKSTKVYKKNE